MGRLYRLPFLFALISLTVGQYAALAQIQSQADKSVPTSGSGTVLSGTILDSLTRKPIELATALLTNSGSKQSVGGLVTGADGVFVFRGIAAGTYTLTVRFVGYQPYVRAGLVVATGSPELAVGTVLLRTGANNLKEVVVQGDRALIEEKVDRLVYNAEKDPSTLGGTAADVLRNVPMLSLDADGNVQLRGSANVRVLINGRPSSLVASSVAAALRQLPAEIIRSVEVMTSPSAKYDAEGTAGIINILTKKNTLKGLTGSGSLTPGNVSTIGFANLSYRQGRFGLTANLGTNQFYNRGTTYLERTSRSDGRRFIQEGRTRNRSGFISPQFGFDLNLSERSSVAGGVRMTTEHNYVRNEQQVRNLSESGTLLRQSPVNLTNRTQGLGYDLNLDFLRTFKKPQQEFSVLTLYSVYEADNQADQDEFGSDRQLTYQQRNLNASQNRELTFQTDYTHPLAANALVEIGAKTIRRNVSSDVSYQNRFARAGTQEVNRNAFAYLQDVQAAYLTYAFKVLRKVNVKLGSRYEWTQIDADFATRDQAFRTRYQNLIPSVGLSYTHREKHTLRVNFTQRIQRPQLFFLNPYREVLSPQVVRVGNPQLAPERTHLLELSYSTYTKTTSFNAGLYGRLTNNAIASFTELRQDTSYTTFLNVARNRTVGVNLFGSVKPTKKTTLNANLNVYHSVLSGLANRSQGWMHNLFTSVNQELPRGWLFSFTGSFNSRRVVLQGRMASFYYHNMTLRKELFQKRGSLGINLANPFMRGTRVRNDLQTPEFIQIQDDINFTRGIRASFGIRFGKLEQTKVRRARKSINNEDALRNP